MLPTVSEKYDLCRIIADYMFSESLKKLDKKDNDDYIGRLERAVATISGGEMVRGISRHNGGIVRHIAPI